MEAIPGAHQTEGFSLWRYECFENGWSAFIELTDHSGVSKPLKNVWIASDRRPNMVCLGLHGPKMWFLCATTRWRYTTTFLFLHLRV